jgi:hypothetical protein
MWGQPLGHGLDNLGGNGTFFAHSAPQFPINMLIIRNATMRCQDISSRTVTRSYLHHVGQRAHHQKIVRH